MTNIDEKALREAARLLGNNLILRLVSDERFDEDTKKLLLSILGDVCLQYLSCRDAWLQDTANPGRAANLIILSWLTNSCTRQILEQTVSEGLPGCGRAAVVMHNLGIITDYEQVWSIVRKGGDDCEDIMSFLHPETLLPSDRLSYREACVDVFPNVGSMDTYSSCLDWFAESEDEWLLQHWPKLGYHLGRVWRFQALSERLHKVWQTRTS